MFCKYPFRHSTIKTGCRATTTTSRSSIGSTASSSSATIWTSTAYPTRASLRSSGHAENASDRGDEQSIKQRQRSVEAIGVRQNIEESAVAHSTHAARRRRRVLRVALGDPLRCDEAGVACRHREVQQGCAWSMCSLFVYFRFINMFFGLICFLFVILR